MLHRVFFLLGLCLAVSSPAAVSTVPVGGQLPTGKVLSDGRPPPESPRPEPPPPGIERFRGSQFQFARLQTSGLYWNRHAAGDPALLDYLRRATVLKIDPVFHSVRADSVEALIVYPFIYCDNVSYLSAAEASNLAEYLRRGGFLCIDACEFRTINPSVPLFLEAQLAMLKGQFANLRTEELRPEHEIFSVYFKLKNAPPYRKARDVLHPTYAVYDGDRLIGLIGLNGMQCGWSDDSAGSYSTECGQMMANIYVYAMTR